MIALNVTGLKKSFGKTEVLKGIDFSVNKGEVLVILGSSGGGKTTLLRCLNFLEIPQEGTISVNGETIFDASDKKEISEDKIKKNRLHFGLVFQQFNLFPQYNVLRNVTLAPSLLKKGSDEEIEKKAKELIKKVGLSDKENNYPCELSGGQQQRVAIARALAIGPDILCFVVPTSPLVPELTGEVLGVIKSPKKNNMTMIIVTHEIDFAREIADKVIFVDNGIILEEGTSDILDNPVHERTKSFLASFSEK